MKSQYPANHKAAVMSVLGRNGGNVPLTAQQTGVGERTLYRWQAEVQPYMQQFLPGAAVSTEMPVFENDLEALAFIRQNIIGELSRLSASLQHDPGFSTPYQRALVMSQLMDKLLKLDLHLKPYIHDNDDEIMVFEGENDYEDDEEDEIIVYEKRTPEQIAADSDDDYDDYDDDDDDY